MFSKIISEIDNEKLPHDSVQYELISSDIIVLKKFYDRNQAWLPFMAGTILRYEIPEVIEKIPVNYQRGIKRKNKQIYSKTRWRDMYQFENNQYTLYFTEFKKLNYDQFQVIRYIENTWDRDSSGKLLSFDYKYISRSDVVRWCKNSLNCLYYIANDKVFFEKEDAFFMFQLRFG